MADDDLRERFAARLRARRISLGLSQHQLADAAGIGRAGVANMENGRQLPSVEAWVRLCGALGEDPGPMLREPDCHVCNDAPPPGFSCRSCGAAK